MLKDSQKPSNKLLGTMLGTAREKLALSQKEIATKLNMNVSVIANLEAENFSALPGQTYIRGYIKHYARIVNLSADELINIYDQILAVAEKKDTLKIIHDVNEQEVPSSRKVNLLDILLYLTTFSIVLICFIWIQQENVLSTHAMVKNNQIETLPIK